ncbi:EAL domain-containing protein [Devosia beringensis]|uniref:EAL domain-containing protein n=1 Tax=Devosia beringensis TaxID=2657486 RepID=UPI00186BA53D|nr:EAL domain-containing protein [Devosia beringensis]
MPRFVSLLIDRAHQRYLGLGLWLATFAVVVLAGAILGGQFVHQKMVTEAQHMLEPHLRLRENVAATFAAITDIVTAAPCSPVFHDQLRQVAFLPDGLNEFLYAPDGVVQCTVTADIQPYDLGAPDVVSDRDGLLIWYDRPLDFIGRSGLTGTILVDDGIGIVTPPVDEVAQSSDWMRFQMVDVAASGQYWPRAGQSGIFASVRTTDGPFARYFPLHDGAYADMTCLPDGTICMATTASLVDVVTANLRGVALAILLGGFLALGISGQIHALLRRFWSFEARFHRHFTPQSILCTYQPILSLATGKISGCEVLVRWRDVDGATVYPDQFLPVVEKLGLGRQLTEYVVAKACEELSAQIPSAYRLQVNFNIFPRDLDAVWLRDTLLIFEALNQRFDAVIEIVETEQLQTEHAQREIDALRRFGIKTHLDDFGTGYSNIENLARLPVDGVKLDRSFAMSADGSLMARMMLNAIDMIHAAGHRITVEGVETPERMLMLRATGQVDFIQGYLISRPIDITRFVQFLADQSVPTPMRPQLVANN